MTGLIHARKAVGVALAASVMLSGCMGTGPEGGLGGFSTAGLFGTGQKKPLTPAEERLREDANTFNKTILGGVAVNAATGAALAALYGFVKSGGDIQQAVAWGAGGAAAGGIYGLIDGYRTATKQEAARHQVREVELMTAKVREENQQLEQTVANASTVIEQMKSELAEVDRKRQSNEITAAQAEVETQHLRSNIAEFDKLIAGARQRQDEFRQVSDSIRQEGEDTAELDAQITASSQRLVELQGQRDLLAQSLEVTPIG